jgi:hypothetical protein
MRWEALVIQCGKARLTCGGDHEVMTGLGGWGLPLLSSQWGGGNSEGGSRKSGAILMEPSHQVPLGWGFQEHLKPHHALFLPFYR